MGSFPEIQTQRFSVCGFLVAGKSVHVCAPDVLACRGLPTLAEDRWLPDGLRTMAWFYVFTKLPRIQFVLPCLIRYNTTDLSKITIGIDHARSRHFSDDPVCPDPVRNPSKRSKTNKQDIARTQQ